MLAINWLIIIFIFFITFTCCGWRPLFEISNAYDAVYAWFDYLKSKGHFVVGYVIMPNHVHVLIATLESHSLSSILHSWKSFTATSANKLLGRTGTFWEREYFERRIRSQRHFDFAVRYILNNPVKAGLCQQFYQYRWTGFSEDAGEIMKRSYLS